MEIVLTNSEEDLHLCAEMMHHMAPWNMLQFSLSDCRKAFNGSFKENYVVKLNAEIIGFAILQVQGAFSGYIQSIAILPAYHNRQLGSQLIAFCEERIFRDMPNVFLCVSSFNEAAQRFYYRNGYEKVGELKDHLVRGHNEYLLRKTKGPRTEFIAKG